MAEEIKIIEAYIVSKMLINSSIKDLNDTECVEMALFLLSPLFVLEYWVGE